MKWVVYDGADFAVSVHDSEQESIVERDKALGRRVLLRADDHPDVLKVEGRKPPDDHPDVLKVEGRKPQ